ncbi:MAG: LamG-like jellyroll fold domain-containing protein [Planctomycetia bacterium]|nr:LamG-like jellyroll fold domain-containing protein [Planctomycetia bacterium]
MKAFYSGLRNWSMALVLMASVIWFARGGFAQGTLTHSYRFDELSGTLTDGTTLVNQATGVADATFYIAGSGTGTVEDGVLRLLGTNNSNGAYISLPSDVVGTKTAITLDAVVTPHTVYNFSRLFDIGGSSNGSRFFGALYGNNGGNTYTQFEGAGSAASSYGLTTGTEYRLTITQSNGSLRYYIDGEVVGMGNVSQDLSTRSGDSNFIGKSHWTGDSYADMSISSFDVYDAAAGPTTIRTLYKNDQGANLDITSAQKVDSLIASSVGYFAASSNNNLYDFSNNHQYNGGTPYRIVENSTVSGDISSLLNNSGWSFQDGYNNDGSAPQNRYMDIYAAANTANPLMDISGSLTLVTRINIDSFDSVINGSENFNYLIRSGMSNGTQTTYVLGTTANSANGNEGGYLQFRLTPEGSTTAISLSSDYQLEEDTWYDVAGVFDADEKTASLYILDTETGNLLWSYVFGEDDGVNFSSLNTLSGERRNFMLMETENNRGGSFLQYMDFASVWDTALSLSDIQALTSTGAQVPEPSTWALLLIGAFALLRLRKWRRV